MKLILMCLLLLLLLQIPGHNMAAANQEPEGISEIRLQSRIDKEKVARPALLPHLQHQWLDCAGCHHSKDPEGKKINFVMGQEVQLCESCHNRSLDMPENVATFKRAGHQLCMECHRQADAAMSKCGVCHPIE